MSSPEGLPSDSPSSEYIVFRLEGSNMDLDPLLGELLYQAEVTQFWAPDLRARLRAALLRCGMQLQWSSVLGPTESEPLIWCTIRRAASLTASLDQLLDLLPLFDEGHQQVVMQGIQNVLEVEKDHPQVAMGTPVWETLRNRVRDLVVPLLKTHTSTRDTALLLNGIKTLIALQDPQAQEYKTRAGLPERYYQWGKSK